MNSEKKREILKYYKDTKKDKDAVLRTAQLFAISEEKVLEVINNMNERKKVWDQDKVTRLRAYLADGWDNSKIANALCIKPQAVADYKRLHKNELSDVWKPEGKKGRKNTVENAKKREPAMQRGTTGSDVRNTNTGKMSRGTSYNGAGKTHIQKAGDALCKKHYSTKAKESQGTVPQELFLEQWRDRYFSLYSDLEEVMRKVGKLSKYEKVMRAAMECASWIYMDDSDKLLVYEGISEMMASFELILLEIDNIFMEIK